MCILLAFNYIVVVFVIPPDHLQKKNEQWVVSVLGEKVPNLVAILQLAGSWEDMHQTQMI